jgi:signal peptidase II
MQGTWTNRRKRIVLLSVAVAILTVLIFLDQWTKYYFSNLVKQNGDKITIINGFFYITHVINTGAAWSFLSNVAWAQILFKILTPIAIVAFCLFYAFALKKNYKWLQISLVLIIGGSIGNYIDRLAINGVTDFISLVFGSYEFPVFNLADCFLVVGVIMIFVHYLFLDKNALFKKKETKRQVDESADNNVKNDKENNAEKDLSDNNE